MGGSDLYLWWSGFSYSSINSKFLAHCLIDGKGRAPVYQGPPKFAWLMVCRWGFFCRKPLAAGSHNWPPAPLGWKLAYARNTTTVENNRNWAELLLHDVYFIRSKIHRSTITTVMATYSCITQYIHSLHRADWMKYKYIAVGEGTISRRGWGADLLLAPLKGMFCMFSCYRRSAGLPYWRG